MAKPLYDKIIRYAKSCPERFHMPAHFGANLDDLLYLSAVFDVTELPFSDNLQSPSGVIAESERQAARCYGSEATLYFTTGATTAIYVALGVLRECAGDLIIARASHKSVYAAARFFGYNVSYIEGRTDGGFPLAVTAEDIEAAIVKNPNAAAVVITSPTYFGAVAGVESILKTVKKYGKRLVVDEAHGAHFPFSDLLPESFSGRADFTVCSLHKTLPVYTGGAVLNVGDAALVDKTRALRADLHTTSPSYVVLASMDFALDELRLYGEVLYEKLYNKVKKFRTSLAAFDFYDNADFSRLVIRLGKRIIRKLYAQNVVPEMTYGDWAVFITSPYNMERLDILEGLLSVERPDAAEKNAETVIVPEEGKDGVGYETVALKDAVGRTAYAEAGIYPPGIPLVAKGERLTEKIVNMLMSADDAFGVIDGKIRVIINKE